jgi:polar amino acid transport system substrate-binding protein
MKRLLGALLLLLVATAARAQSIDAIEKRHALRVGMFPGLMPFVAVGDDATDLERRAHSTIRHATDGRAVAGFDVDLAAAAAQALGVSLEIVLVPRFDDLLPGLADGKYDVVMSGLTRTLPRARLVSFSDPYFASGLQVLTPEPARFGTLASVGAAHARVAVRAGTTAETFARASLPGSVVQPLPTDDAVLAAVAAHKADAAVLDYVNARDAEVRGRAPIKLVAVEERRFTVEHFAFAVRHGDADWLGWLNLMLRETKASGEFHVLAARYNAWFRSER